jgi:acyl-CoA synthetase (AMP-forming)/AMP-acid ligase II
MTAYSTIDSAFRTVAEARPDATALVDGSMRVSYAELDDQVSRVAGGLAGLGARPGDRLAIWLPNSLEWAVAFLAATRIGAVVVPVNTGLSIDEAAYVVGQSGARILVLPDTYRSRSYLPDALKVRERLSAAELRLVLVGGSSDEVVSWAALSAAGPIPREAADASPDDPCVILYTSGTTGAPKGAVHSHRFLGPLLSAAARLGLGPDDAVVLYLPMYHVYGLLAGLVMMLLSGSRVVVMRQFDAARSLDLIESEQATIVFGIPTTYIDQLAVPDVGGRDLSAVRAAFTPFPPDLCRRVSQVFGTCLGTYGMTETASIAFLASLEDPLEEAIATTGYPVDELEVRIEDVSTSAALPAGQAGALLLRGPSIMTHYFDKPEETARARTPDGWFRTGDLASVDAAGRLSFHGRQSDQLRVGGEMVDPVEIEMALQSHPGVERAAVAGVADDRLGQVPFAWVQLSPGAECEPAALADYVAPRLAWFKRPRRITVVESFPTTPSGKIQKYVLLAGVEGAPAGE